MKDQVIQAAGGIVTRRRGERDEVLIVRRARYDDWTFPKGKLEKGESAIHAAVREVREETGVAARIGRYLGALGYPVGDRSKIVQYWRMSVASEGAFSPDDEVQERLWLSIDEALGRLTYPLERAFLLTLRTQLARRA